MSTIMRATRLAVSLACCVAWPVFAGDAVWTDLRATLYGDQLMVTGTDIITIDAPYRSQNDLRTRISGQIALPQGKTIKTVSVILDENPMPVSAVFDLHQPTGRFAFDITFRFDRSTPLHVVAQTTDGQLFMQEVFVKTSGTGACAAPPGTDPELALATLGNMQLNVSAVPDAKISLAGLNPVSDPASDPVLGSPVADQKTPLPAQKMLEIAIDHPSHSGLQMDQISLLFIPARFIDTVDVDIDGRDFVAITGSMSLSENPDIKLSLPASAAQVEVELTDTDDTVSTAQKLLTGF